MTTDWVPCNYWGGQRTVGLGSQLDIPLLDEDYIGDIALPDGVPEEGIQRMRVLRIVGQYDLYWQTTFTGSDVPVHCRLWPGMVVDGPSTIVPGDISLVENANARFWWERHHRAPVYPNSLHDSYAHMGWSHLDIRPKQLLRDRELPVFSVRNPNLNYFLYVVLHLRLLVAL